MRCFCVYVVILKTIGLSWVLAVGFVAVGCSSSPSDPGSTGTGGSGSGGTTGGSGGTTPGEDAGSGGSTAGSGGSGSGGMTAPGTGGTVVVDAPVESGDAPGTDGPAQNFTCSLILGAGQTTQWFGGFETALGTAKWEIKATDNTYTEAWANPGSAFWNVAVQSPCTTNATMPDRVLYIVYSKTLTAQAEWETQLGMVMANIKTKYPSVQKIDLLTMVRGPQNMMCGSAVATTVSAAQDQAMQAVADRSAGMISVGPKYFAPTCAAFATANNTNLTPAGGAAVAQMVAAFYK